MGYVYMIGPVEVVKPYRVKIGKANDVASRLADLQCASAFRLEVLWEVRTDHPLKLERQIHAELARYRCQGEWFQLGPDPVPFAERAANLYGHSGVTRNRSVPWRRRRPRNPHCGSTHSQRQILDALDGATGSLYVGEIMDRCPEIPDGTVRVLLSKLTSRGDVRRTGRGMYEISR